MPFSLDPLDYDALAHHICFRSVYSSLVTDYKLGEIKGVVASNWEVNTDKNVWIFHIRDNLTFSNGKQITANEVTLSLNRAALIMQKEKSESGLLENLIGVENINSADSLIEGISTKNNSVILKFKKPMTDVLEKISFGLYAITSSENYHPKTGEWLDKKSLIGSGAYIVRNWSENELELKLRTDYPKELTLSHPIHTAKYSFAKETILESDIVIEFDDALSIDDQFKFHGPVKSAIRYIQCESWNVPGSICNDRETRKTLRDEFYNSLKNKYTTVKSFLPLAIKGTKEFEMPTLQQMNISKDYQNKTFSISKVNPSYKSGINKIKITAQEAFDLGMNSVAQSFDFKLETFTPDPKAPLSGNVDFRFRMTAILVDSPSHDILFMFNSAHGIKLPDEFGEIKKYINNDDNFSAVKVNEMLWDQAIIWPIGHMALGIWKKENTVSFSNYNLILPPLDLQWIEWE